MQAFICHSPLDEVEARRIGDFLRETGMTCCRVDDKADAGGIPVISDSLIEESDIVVALLSKNTTNSSFVEIGIARAKKKTIIVVVLDGTFIPSEFAGINYAVLSENSIEGWAKLYGTLLKILSLQEIALDAVKWDKKQPLRIGKESAAKEEPKVFLSHNSGDSVRVNEYRKNLEEHGIPCWIAPRDIPYGSNYADELPNAIAHCRCMLVFISEKSLGSKEVKKEIGIASRSGKTMIPVYLEDCKLRGAFETHLGNNQWYAAYNAEEKQINNLLRALENLNIGEEPIESQSGNPAPNEPTQAWNHAKTGKTDGYLENGWSRDVGMFNETDAVDEQCPLCGSNRIVQEDRMINLTRISRGCEQVFRYVNSVCLKLILGILMLILATYVPKLEQIIAEILEQIPRVNEYLIHEDAILRGRMLVPVIVIMGIDMYVLAVDSAVGAYRAYSYRRSIQKDVYRIIYRCRECGKKYARVYGSEWLTEQYRNAPADPGMGVCTLIMAPIVLLTLILILPLAGMIMAIEYIIALRKTGDKKMAEASIQNLLESMWVSVPLFLAFPDLSPVDTQKSTLERKE